MHSQHLEQFATDRRQQLLRGRASGHHHDRRERVSLKAQLRRRRRSLGLGLANAGLRLAYGRRRPTHLRVR